MQGSRHTLRASRTPPGISSHGYQSGRHKRTGLRQQRDDYQRAASKRDLSVNRLTARLCSCALKQSSFLPLDVKHQSSFVRGNARVMSEVGTASASVICTIAW